MSYLEIIETADSTYAEGSLSSSVVVALSPDNVRGLHDDGPAPGQSPSGLGYWDWVAGYQVAKTSQGKHDGYPATLMTLADSDGNREIGRMVVRNDALRGDRLEVVRQFESDEERDAWVESVTAKPVGLPDDFVKVEARTVMAGDTIFVESDPDDDGLENGTVAVKSVEVQVYEGKVMVTLVRDEATASTFMPGEWSDHAPDEQVWVKRA